MTGFATATLSRCYHFAQTSELVAGEQWQRNLLIDVGVLSCLRDIVKVLNKARVFLVRTEVVYKKRCSLLVFDLIIVRFHEVRIGHSLLFDKERVFYRRLNSVLWSNLASAVIEGDLLPHLSHEVLNGEGLPDDLVVMKRGRSKLDFVFGWVQIFAIVRLPTRPQIIVLFSRWLIIIVNLRSFEDSIEYLLLSLAIRLRLHNNLCHTVGT